MVVWEGSELSKVVEKSLLLCKAGSSHPNTRLHHAAGQPMAMVMSRVVNSPWIDSTEYPEDHEARVATKPRGGGIVYRRSERLWYSSSNQVKLPFTVQRRAVGSDCIAQMIAPPRTLSDEWGKDSGSY